MPVVEERVTNLEEIFARFLESSEKRYIQNDIRMKKFDEKMDRMSLESRLRMQQFDKEMKKLQEESENNRKKHDEEMKKLREASEARSKKHDEEMKKFQEASEIRSKKFEEEMKKLREVSEARSKKHDEEMRQIKKDSEKKYQDLIHKLGTFLEDIVAPNIPGIAQEVFEAGEATFFAIRAKVKKSNGETREFDAVYISETTFFLNESKSNPKIEYIDDFVEAIRNIYDYFPMYKDKTFIPVFSSFHIPENVKKYLSKNRIYGMQIKDDTMEIINFDELQKS